MFLRKGVLKICSKFTGEHPCRSAISIKLQSNFIKIALRHGRSPVNLLHILRTLFLGKPLGGCFWFYCNHFTGMKCVLYFDVVIILNIEAQFFSCLYDKTLNLLSTYPNFFELVTRKTYNFFALCAMIKFLFRSYLLHKQNVLNYVKSLCVTLRSKCITFDPIFKGLQVRIRAIYPNFN